MLCNYADFKHAIKEEWVYITAYSGGTLYDAGIIDMLERDDPAPIEKGVNPSHSILISRIMSSALEYGAINVFKKLSQHGNTSIKNDDWQDFISRAALAGKKEFVDFALTKTVKNKYDLASTYAMGGHYEHVRETLGEEDKLGRFYTNLALQIRNKHGKEKMQEMNRQIMGGALRAGLVPEDRRPVAFLRWGVLDILLDTLSPCPVDDALRQEIFSRVKSDEDRAKPDHEKLTMFTLRWKLRGACEGIDGEKIANTFSEF